MNQQLIARLRNGEIAAENNGTLEQLRAVLKAAFPDFRYSPSGDARFYKKMMDDRWTGFGINLGDKAVPITDFFLPSVEDRAVELLSEIVEADTYGDIKRREDAIYKADLLLAEINKTKEK